MLNEIMNAISQKIRSVFGSEYKIYFDEIAQGFKEPCFFISLLQANQKQIIGNRYFREHFFDIHYYPKSTAGITREVNEVTDKLLMALEYISIGGDLIRGTKMKHEVHDDVLHFFVNYDVFVKKVIEKGPLMMEYTQTQKLKG
ncbi:phage tail terminator family protein [Anaerosinus sp.]